MHDRTAIALRIASGMIVISGYLALAAVRNYGIVMIAIPAILLPLAPIGEGLDRRYPLYRVTSRAMTIAFACFIPFSVLSLGLMPAVILVIIYVQAYSLLHRKAASNYYHLFLMSFFLLLAGCVQSPESFIAFVLILFLVSAIWAFLALRLHEESQRSLTQSTPTFLPLGAEAKITFEDDRDLFDFGLITAICLVSVMAVLMTAALFFLTPRIEAGFLATENRPQTLTGLSETVGLRGDILVQEDETAVMRVEFPDAVSRPYVTGRPMYWRVTTLSSYYGNEWRRARLSRHLEPDIGALRPTNLERGIRSNPRELSRPPRPGYTSVQQVIYMDSVPDQGVPCLDLVRAVKVAAPTRNTEVIWDAHNDFTVRLMTTGPRRLTYEVWSEIGDPAAEELTRLPSDLRGSIQQPAPPPRQGNLAPLFPLSTRPGRLGGRGSRQDILRPTDYALLTEHNLLPETVALAETLTQDHEAIHAKADALEQWLSGSSFLYTLDVPPLPQDHPIDAFVTSIRRGHCQLYSSAMALMLRALGIPTRVVSGYRGGEWNPDDSSYTVRASMAHLWVEVFIPDAGWSVFDPSPAPSDAVATGLGRLQHQISRLGLKMKMFWFRDVIGFDHTLQLARLRSFLGGIFRSPASSGDADAPFFLSLSPRILLLTTAVCTGCAMAAWLRRWWRKRDRTPVHLLTEDQARAVRLYRRLCRRVKRAGGDLQGKTAEELQHLVLGRDWAGAGTAAGILQVYNEVRFGMRPLPKDRYRELMQSARRLQRRG